MYNLYRMNNQDRMNNPHIKDNAVIEILTHGAIFLDNDKKNKIRYWFIL